MCKNCNCSTKSIQSTDTVFYPKTDLTQVSTNCETPLSATVLFRQIDLLLTELSQKTGPVAGYSSLQAAIEGLKTAYTTQQALLTSLQEASTNLSVGDQPVQVSMGCLSGGCGDCTQVSLQWVLEALVSEVCSLRSRLDAVESGTTNQLYVP